MESSKVTAKHIRQVAGDLPTAQIQLMRHQHTQLPTGNYPEENRPQHLGWKPQNCKTPGVPTSRKPSDMQRPDVHSDKCTGAATHACKGISMPS